MDTEIELKFLVSEQVIAKLPSLITQFSKKVSNSVSRNLQNTYFDTPSRELRSLDIGLRTRCVDGECEQTIKLAGKVLGGLHQRPEFNIPINSARPNILLFDSNIWPYGLEPKAISDNLYSIFNTHFIRRTWHIETQSGSQIELVLDKGEISASGNPLVGNSLAGNPLVKNSEPICEVEMELVSGLRADLFTLATKLINCSEVRLGSYSKAARGYRLADKTPLVEDSQLDYVKLNQHATQEQAFEKCLQYGIEFVQKHEQCYVDSPKLKTLKRIIEGISLIRHSFWLFEHIVNKEATKALRKELKWLLHSFDWVETAIQLNQFTSKKHAFYKKISAAPELETVIESLKAKYPNERELMTIFYSPRYNQLILDLTLFLVEKRWREDWQKGQCLSGASTAAQPVKEIAAALFASDWTETQNLLPHDVVTTKSYIDNRQKLQRNILSGYCLGELFKSTQRDKFRKPWLDIIKGIGELATYDYLKQICEEQLCKELLHEEQQPNADKFAKILNWLEQKKLGLLSAMEHSRLASQKLSPYWQ